MFFVLSKDLAFLFSPIIWILALLLLSLVSRHQQRKKKFLITSVILLFFCSNSFIFDEFMRWWEVPATRADTLQTYDAGIILSGMINYDKNYDRMQFNRRNDRLMQAIELYKKGKIKKMFFTGGSGILLQPEDKESLMAKRFLSTIGIPEGDFIIESESDNTHENALLSKPILFQSFGSNGKYLLITSASHMRRAVSCFRKEGIELTPYSVDRYSGPRKYLFDHLIIPNAQTLFNWDLLLHEWIGMIVYKIAGYV